MYAATVRLTFQVLQLPTLLPTAAARSHRLHNNTSLQVCDMPEIGSVVKTPWEQMTMQWS